MRNVIWDDNDQINIIYRRTEFLFEHSIRIRIPYIFS